MNPRIGSLLVLFFGLFDESAHAGDEPPVPSVLQQWGTELTRDWTLVKPNGDQTQYYQAVSEKRPLSRKSAYCYFISILVDYESRSGTKKSLAQLIVDGRVSYYYANRKGRHLECKSISDEIFFEVAHHPNLPIDYRILKAVGKLESGGIIWGRDESNVFYETDGARHCFSTDLTRRVSVIFVDPYFSVNDAPLLVRFRVECETSDSEVRYIDIYYSGFDSEVQTYRLRDFRQLAEGPP